MLKCMKLSYAFNDYQRLIHESLVYQRPQSLEETPAREVGSFMKDNRIDDLSDDNDNGLFRRLMA